MASGLGVIEGYNEMGYLLIISSMDYNSPQIKILLPSESERRNLAEALYFELSLLSLRDQIVEEFVISQLKSLKEPKALSSVVLNKN